jgi:Uma2 family endonuclease
MARDAAAPWAEEVLVTAEDLMALSDEGWHYELVQGRLVCMPPTGLEHGAIGVRLSAALLQFVDEGGLGLVTGAETGFLLSQLGEPDTVLAPDIAFIAANRLPASESREWKVFPRLSPDLVVEIASSSQHRPEMAVKAKLWLGASVPLVWVI